MTTEPKASKPSRAPWIVAGALVCLVLCLFIVVAGGAVYMFTRPVSAPVPLAALPTQAVPPSATPQVADTATPPALPTLAVPPTLPSDANPTALPTLAPVPTQGPSTSGGLPTLAPLVQPTSASAASSKAVIAFSVNMGDRPEDKYIWVMNSDGTDAHKILDRASEPSFSPDGKQIAYYHWTDGIFVYNSDGTTRKILGDSNVGFIAWSHDGKYIAVSAQPGGAGNIVIDLIPPDGNALKTPTARRNIAIGESPSWSPDDSQITFHTCRGSSCGIYKSNSGGGDAVPVSADDGGLPAWSPDGERIVYQKDVDGQKQLFVIDVDGSNKKQLTSGAALHVDAEWSPDGNSIFYRSPAGGTWAIWRMNADGSSPVKLIDNMAPVSWPYERLAVTR